MITWRYGNKAAFMLLVSLDLLVSIQNVFLAFVTSSFIKSATDKNMTLFFRVAYLSVIGFIIISIINWFHISLKNKIIRQTNLRIKHIFTKNIIDGINRVDSANGIATMTGDLKMLETNGISNELLMIEQAFTVVATVIGGIYFNFLTTFIFVLGSLIPVLISRFSQSGIQRSSQNWSRNNTTYTQFLKDIFSGSDTIRLYLAKREALNRADKSAESLEYALNRMNNTTGHANVYTTLAALIFGVTIPFGFGIYQTITGVLTLAAFMGIVQISNSISNPLISMISEGNVIQTTRSIKNRLDELPITESGRVVLINDKRKAFKSLALKEVSIQINQKTILNDISLDLTSGEKILIKAPSGFGKTTLLRALIGDVSVHSGEYRLNDLSVSQISKVELKQYFGFVHQNPFIFNDTIIFNITLGQRFSQELIEEVVHEAKLTTLVTQKGLDYIVGENGANISGGQAQRIEIARALIRKRPVLLADEVTSALDEKTSLSIHDLLLGGAYSLIEVAHHIDSDTAKRFDKCIDLSQI